jgi:hypothetical protein
MIGLGRAAGKITEIFGFLWVSVREICFIGLTLMSKGKIACNKNEAREIPHCERDASRAGLFEMRIYLLLGRSQVHFGQPNPATDEKDRGSVYVVTLPAFQRCLEDGPDAAERRPGSGFPTGRGTGYGHLEAHHDLQARPARPRKV